MSIKDFNAYWKIINVQINYGIPLPDRIGKDIDIAVGL